MKLLSFFLYSFLFFSITSLFTIFYTSLYLPSDDSTHDNLVKLNSSSSSSSPKTLSAFLRMKKRSWKKPLPPPPPPPPVEPFDFFMLVETWPPAFCLVNPPCGNRVPSPLRFTLHGVWPGRDSPIPPRDCGGDPFLLNNLDSRKMPELERVWPDLTQNVDKYDLWVRQWIKHGTCTGLNQAEYLDLGLDLHKKTSDIKSILKLKGIEPTSEASRNHSPFKRQDIADAIQEHFGFYPQLHCAEKNNKVYLVEVRFCFEASDTKNKRDCPSRWTRSCTSTEDIYFIL